MQDDVNPFHSASHFLYPLKTSENLWFSNVFRGYRKRPVAWFGLMMIKSNRASLNQVKLDVFWDAKRIKMKEKGGNTWNIATSIYMRLNPATLPNVTLLHECFSRFLNCKNGTKLRKAPDMRKLAWMKVSNSLKQ